MVRSTLFSLLALGASAPAWALDHCGQIPVDTTWTAADSPVHVTCESYVNPGVTLTVEEGVEITFDDVTFYVIGHMSVEGSAAQRVVFRADDPLVGWQGIRVEGSVQMEGARIQDASLGLRYQTDLPSLPGFAWDFRDVEVVDNGIGLDILSRGRRAVVQDSLFQRNDTALQGSEVSVSGSTFEDTTYDAVYDRRALVVDNTFTNNGTGVRCGYLGEVHGNTFTGNDIGANLSSCSVFEDNAVTGNRVGLYLENDNGSVVDNDLSGNTDHAAEVASFATDDPIDLQLNWWGTTDPAAIEAMVYDQLDLPLLSRVDSTNPLPAAPSTQLQPPEITSFTWTYSPFVQMGIRIDCDGFDPDGSIVVYAGHADNLAGFPDVLVSNTINPFDLFFPQPGIYEVWCEVVDDDGLVARSDSELIPVLDDDDDDGILDPWDACPLTPAGTLVDDRGCPLRDWDFDGVADDWDLCLDTPPGAATDQDGCTAPDTDGDGVIDANDDCPASSAGALVGSDGCDAPDTDGDGVPDALDSCAGSVAGALVDAIGCDVTDTDDDGVPDVWDQCADTVPGTLVDPLGCAGADTDLDGVVDAWDACPGTAAGTLVGWDGCELSDGDGDGVIDGWDLCPSTPSLTVVDSSGCAVDDTDADGVLDPYDSCPGSAAGALVDAFGCAYGDGDGDGVIDPLDACPGTVPGAAVDADGCALPPAACAEATFHPPTGVMEIPEVLLPTGQCLSATMAWNGSAMELVGTGPCADACEVALISGSTLIVPSLQVGTVTWWVELQRTTGGDFALVFAFPR